MTTYTVTPSQTQDQTVARFELSPALELVQASKYNNIDEAKDAPLVQQMFYLPFVKSVVLKKEALEIERFNILEWKDVLEDVSLEIENYLNKGGVVLNETQPLKKVPITIYAESTPNPGVRRDYPCPFSSKTFPFSFCKRSVYGHQLYFYHQI